MKHFNFKFTQNGNLKKSSIFSRISIFLMLFFISQINAQISGNRIYQDNNPYSRNEVQYNTPSFIVTDSTMQINIKILLNQSADKYRIVLGVSDEGLTPKQALEKINLRIKGFSNQLSKLKIEKEDFYVDYITQTKIQDYDVDNMNRIISQKTIGYEVKKNIIIMTNEFYKIDEIISAASEFKISDIIKVDYINTDVEKIKERILDEAYQLQDDKRISYQKRLKIETVGHPRIVENFNIFFPKNQYQDYAISESSNVDISYYNNDYIRKNERKSKTFFYEGIDEASFDRIIKGDQPEIGIQYVISLSASYDLKRK